MSSKGRIFVSYASDCRDQAEPIALALRSRDYEVFFDKDDLPAGETYHDQIASAIDETDILVFLISPESVDKGRYTLTEMNIARRRWQTPKGRVLPIIIEPTPIESIPAYLKEVSFFEPSGNLVAETGLEVDRLMGAIREEENQVRISKVRRIAVTALGLSVLALALIGLFHGSIPFLNSDDPGKKEAGLPPGLEVVRTPRLGMQFFQDGERLRMFEGETATGEHSRNDFWTVTIPMSRQAFEVRIPDSSWPEQKGEDTSLKVALFDSDEIFDRVEVYKDSSETPFFMPGTGVADHEHGSSTLWSTHWDDEDCCDSHNYVIGNRFNTSAEGYKGFFIGNLFHRLTGENMLQTLDEAFLVFYLDKDGGPNWDDPDPMNPWEVEGIVLKFTE